MRIARVIGTVTLSRKLPDLKPGRYVIADAFDADALRAHAADPSVSARRKSPMPESLVVFDDLGVGVNQLIAVSEGREATMPFYPEKVPIDAYCAAILDVVETERGKGV